MSMASEKMDNIFDKYLNIYNNEIEQEQNISEKFLFEYEFKLPIEYNKNNTINKNIQEDIELTGDNNIMNVLIKTDNNDNQYNLLLDKWSSIYSTDKQYIKDNQSLIKNFIYKENNMDNFIDEYVQFKNEKNFLSKYQYIQFKRLFHFNSIVGLLQILAIYNICTPVISLLSPLIGLIVPYFILYMKGVKLSFKNYIKLIKTIILKNYKLEELLNFQNRSLQQNMYTIFSIFFYGLSIYNNIIYCIQFYNNTNYIIEFIKKYKNFIYEGEELINNTLKQTDNLRKFKQFNTNLKSYKQNIKEIKTNLSIIENEDSNYKKYGQIGFLLKYNFDFFYNQKYHDTMMYLIYLNNYNKDVYHFSSHVKNNLLNKCKIVDKNKKTKIKNMYYLPHINENKIIKNDLSLKKNIIITGPNASGKTTLIKSTIINLFLSQTIGYGCYSKCNIPIYDHFHCYLNIPDTSNRDSLFQAEARRCKEILEFIEENKNKNHFCIFDEIYSGTNPGDAVLCASLYLDELNKYKKKVDYLITTHYIDICNKFDDNENTINKKMKSIQHEDGKIEYFYKCENGISKINGGLQILVDMKYPDNVINKNK